MSGWLQLQLQKAANISYGVDLQCTSKKFPQNSKTDLGYLGHCPQDPLLSTLVSLYRPLPVLWCSLHPGYQNFRMLRIGSPIRWSFVTPYSLLHIPSVATFENLTKIPREKTSTQSVATFLHAGYIYQKPEPRIAPPLVATLEPFWALRVEAARCHDPFL